MSTFTGEHHSSAVGGLGRTPVGRLLLVVLGLACALLAAMATARLAYASQTTVHSQFNSINMSTTRCWQDNIQVSGLAGRVTDVDLTLFNFDHEFPDNVDIMLGAPDHTHAVVMSDAGGFTRVEDLNITLDDEAGSQLPDGSPLSSGAFQPTNHEPNNDGPGWQVASELSAFDGIDPNGEWGLCIQNDFPAFPGEGALSEGYDLIITTDNNAPTISSVRPTPGSSVRDRTPLIAATVSDVHSDLAQSDISLFVDGRAKSFSYNATTDGLSRQSNRLAVGRHTVRIEATDPQGLTAVETWTFRVRR